MSDSSGPTLAPGARLGAYEVLGILGAGGMGQVYRARDSRLGRDVAIKTSKEQFSARFEREARLIASLNHPNICTLHDVGPDYLVMELVEGESPRGPLPLATVLAYARQIAAALDAAHERGIVHRDLKPANIKVTPQGLVKVLDFGVAKVVDAPGGSGDDGTTHASGDQHRIGRRHAGLHVAGAGCRPARGQAHGHLGVWRDSVRASHRLAAVSR